MSSAAPCGCCAAQTHHRGKAVPAPAGSLARSRSPTGRRGRTSVLPPPEVGRPTFGVRRCFAASHRRKAVRGPRLSAFWSQDDHEAGQLTAPRGPAARCAPSPSVMLFEPGTTRRRRHEHEQHLVDRDVLHLDLRGTRRVEAIDPVVDDRAQQQQHLADDVGDLLLELGRDELAQRAQERDEGVELVAGVLTGDRRPPRRPGARRRPARPGRARAARRAGQAGPSKVTRRAPSSKEAPVGR